MNNYFFTVTEEEQGERLDKYLATCFPEVSRSFIQKLLKQQQVTVNDTLGKASYTVKENDRIQLHMPEAVEPEILAEDIPLDVLYEDNDVLVVNKPKGMVVHPAPGHYSGTLVNAVMYHCKGNLSGINGVLRPGIVHRIDKDTTGSLIICKNDVAHNSLAQQLKEHTIHRKYVAVVHGVLKEEEGVINAPIGRNPNDRMKMAVNYQNGKDAITHYKVLDRSDNFTLIECVLETGRTHQIRVHMASIHHPLLGDAVYGPAKCPYKLQGQTLHAMILGFVHPVSGGYIEVTAPLPEYMTELFRKLHFQWTPELL